MIKSIEMAAVLAVAGSAVRLLRVKLPRGEERSFDTAIAVLALWHLGVCPAIAISVLSSSIEALYRRLLAKEPVFRSSDAALDAARRLLVLLVVGFALLVAPNSVEGDGVIAAVLVLGCLHALLDEASHRALMTVRAKGRRGPSQGAMLPIEPITSIYALHIVLSSSASRLMGLLGVWGVVLQLSILLLLQYGLVMYMRIRLAYSQTIAAISRAIEMALDDVPGSSRALADLAVVVGKQVGLKSETLEDLNYAALLRRIGWIGLIPDAEAVPGTSSAAIEGRERSARVLSSIEFLKGAAKIIAPSAVGSESVAESAVAAQVLEVCALYQEEISSSGLPEFALQRLGDRLQVSEQVMRALEHEVRCWAR